MDKYEARRLALRTLIDDQCDGKQVDFADVLGIPASYVSRMLFEPGKKGARRIGDDLAGRIEAAFGLKFGALSVNAVQPATHLPVTNDEKTLIQGYRRASKEIKIIMLRMAETVLFPNKRVAQGAKEKSSFKKENTTDS